jgi:hypothetical protein
VFASVLREAVVCIIKTSIIKRVVLDDLIEPILIVDNTTVIIQCGFRGTEYSNNSRSAIQKLSRATPPLGLGGLF